MKKSKKPSEWHSSKSKVGLGDFQGIGVKQKVGRIRSVYPVDYSPMTNKQMGKPPKSLA